MMRRVLPLLLSIEILAGSAVPSTMAAELSDSEKEIDRLANLIVHKEIDLERYYLNYRQHGTKEPKFRRIRYFLLQVGAASCTLASNIMYLKAARDGMKSSSGNTDFGLGDADTQPQRQPPRRTILRRRRSGSASSGNDANPVDEGEEEVDEVEEDDTPESSPSTTSGSSTTAGNDVESGTNFLRNTYIVSIMGVLLDAGSSVVELTSNSYTAIKNLRIKRSPGVAVQEVASRVNEIDALLEKRHALIETEPYSEARKIHKAEGRVLRAFRDWCISEFAEIYADVKSNEASNNIYYLLDLAGDSCYLVGLILALKALKPGKDRLNGPALQNSIIGDALAIASVPASSIGYNRLYSYYQNRLLRKLKKNLHEIEEDTKGTMHGLQQEIDSATRSRLECAGAVTSRLRTYITWAEKYDTVYDASLAELKRQAKVAYQGEVSGPLISSTYLTSDLLSTIAFYGTPNRPRTGAALSFAGSIVGTVGTSTSLALTNWNLLTEIASRRKMRKSNTLPEQLLAQRLKTLDDLDAMITRAEKGQL